MKLRLPQSVLDSAMDHASEVKVMADPIGTRIKEAEELLGSSLMLVEVTWEGITWDPDTKRIIWDETDRPLSDASLPVRLRVNPFLEKFVEYVVQKTREGMGTSG